MNNKQLWIIGGVFLAAILGAGLLFMTQSADQADSTKYDSFASCLKDKGLIFYGAFWCPHCREQKAMFGKSASLLPYVECSTPDGNGTYPVCLEKEIKSYPTWVFPDGTRQTGTLPLETLAEKSSCALPQ